MNLDYAVSTVHTVHYVHHVHSREAAKDPEG